MIMPDSCMLFGVGGKILHEKVCRLSVLVLSLGLRMFKSNELIIPTRKSLLKAKRNRNEE